MTEHITNELLSDNVKVPGVELGAMSSCPGNLTSIMREEQKHTCAVVLTDNPHEETFARFQLCLERIARRLDLHA